MSQALDIFQTNQIVYKSLYPKCSNIESPPHSIYEKEKEKAENRYWDQEAWERLDALLDSNLYLQEECIGNSNQINGTV